MALSEKRSHVARVIAVIILVIALLGGFSGRFGGPGYGYGDRGNGAIGLLLVIILVLVHPTTFREGVFTLEENGPVDRGRILCRMRFAYQPGRRPEPSSWH